ncbi:methyl-accepting chemotaxis protein [Vibrio diazotrophicus]|uniref:methyl-accepting chemotaxis protein n=1 Tax=Vibrio diazotrophicus TaxID=685 RepID=UPI00142E240E|nr:methyl-accepting chemotaxis protein [Vibrio diazotrophicus]NIY91183.1 methyl-accepting chemotaxis protein [Vibrio diazotrophicus]
MHLTPEEKGWLPWFGKTGKLAMRKACWFNRKRKASLEQTFENIANTRVKILTTWAENQWSFLHDASLYLSTKSPDEYRETLSRLLNRSADLSELFIVSAQGEILESTFPSQKNKKVISTQALNEGLVQPFLHGPYRDAVTLAIGPSSSHFHDEVTLMFYQPIELDGDTRGCLCGRIPNDVIGDLIQREAGHIYSESGDNYLFMVNSHFDPSIKQGVALSRSRFEDNHFSHGENLKDGVNTKWGVVKVSRHTEFEIVFNDPATNKLHPGVRETIKNGHNLYIDYPGYSDYRHIPVIGKGVTFTMPGSKDRWGMMCESDLEEVYRHRSVAQKLNQQFAVSVFGPLVIPFVIEMFYPLGNAQLLFLSVLLGLMAIGLFHIFSAKPMANNLETMTQVMQVLAEGDGNLTRRLDASKFKSDETGDLGRWTNSFIDSLEGIIQELVFASKEVKNVSESMFRRSQLLLTSSDMTATSITDMLSLAGVQSQEINSANDTATEMHELMQQTVHAAQLEYQKAAESAQEIKNIVQSSAHTVNDVNEEMQKIGNIVSVITEITAQTNLLALNAAIEAARAGEHGRGFSVVADEVRVLANKTSQAANSIGELMTALHTQSQRAVSYMQEGITNVENSTQVVDESSRSERLQTSVTGLFTLIQDIARNSEEHRQTADEAQSTVVKLQEASSQLSRRTALMQNSLQRLDQLVGRFEVRKAS